MKTLISNSLIMLAFLAGIFPAKGLAQDMEVVSPKISHLSLGLSLVPSRIQINNQMTSSLSKVKHGNKSTVSGSIDLGFSFSEFMGIISGIGFSSYKTDLSLDSYQNTVTLKDNENDSYEHSVNGSVIKEQQKITFLFVPVKADIIIPVTEKGSFYVQPGISFNFPVGSSYSSSGKFTYTSYYPLYNVLLKDVPALGLTTNTNVSTEDGLEVKSFTMFATMAAGFQYFVNKKFQIGLGLNYVRSLSAISTSQVSDNFELSPGPTTINSMLEGSNRTSLQSMGLRLSVRYILR